VVNNTRTAGGLVKMGITLAPEQCEEIGRIAREKQLSVAAVIRTAVREYIVRQNRLAQRKAS
jgi:hypothetical protein